jgi:hypothetical protein
LVDELVRYSHRGYELLLYQADDDMRYLIPPLSRLVEKGYSVWFSLSQDQRIIYCKIAQGRHRWYIRDVQTMLPVDMEGLRSLSGLGPDAAPEYVIGHAFRKLGDTLRDTFGVRPSVSASTTALHAWLTTLPEDHIFYKQREDVDTIARAGYFGGLTWVQSLADKGACTEIDCNAMFAHAMRQGVPVCSPMETDLYNDHRPGIWNCKVFCPASVPFHFVPGRAESGRVIYPRATWYDTVLTSETINYARSLGYEIETGVGYVFERTEPVFDEFINRCEQLEIEYRGQGAQQVIKALRNSLYGKFGTRPQCTEYCLSSETDAMINADWTPVLTWDGGEIIDNLWWRDIEIDRPYMMPHWSMWITANARLILARAVYALGPAGCYYGDTDSIIVAQGTLTDRPEVCTIGTGYGQWKVAEQYQRLCVRGPRLYAGLTIDNEWVTITAGIAAGTLVAADIERLRPGVTVETKPTKQGRRALLTMGNGPPDDGEYLVKQITVPELQPIWAGPDYS